MKIKYALLQVMKKEKLNSYLSLITKKSTITFSIITLLAFCIFFNQASCRIIRSDLGAHIQFMKQHFEQGRRLDHPFFHYVTYYISQLFSFNLVATAIVILTLSVLISAIIIFLILNESLRNDYSENIILFFTFCLMIVSAIYLPFFNKNIYLGQSSPNVWHNPTTVVVKPFAFLSILLFIYLLNIENTKKLIMFSILEAALIAISVSAKPNFFMSFFPAVYIFLLLRVNLFKKYFWKFTVISIPALAILAWEYFMRFEEGGESKIIIDFLGVWSHYTPNVFISLLLLIAFPISVLIFYFKKVIKNDFLVLSWLVFLIALLQYSIFAEAYPHHYHGNFGWGRQIILPMVFTFSVVEFMKLIKEPHRNKWGRYKKYFVSLCFSLHVISGLCYLAMMFITGSFH